MFPDPDLAINEDTHLGLVTLSHAQEFCNFINRERKDFEPYFPWVRLHRTLEDFKRFIKRDMERFRTGERMCVGVWHKTRLVGIIRLPIIEDGAIAEVTRLFAKEARGKAYVIESYVAFFDFLFKECGIHRIEAYCSPDNVAAVKSLQRMRFVAEGRRREALRINGHFGDLNTYGMLKQDWEELRRKEYFEALINAKGQAVFNPSG